MPLVRLGSGYGGWWVPVDLPSVTWVCCCAGVGEDLTFDLALIERFRCRVVAVDPTPRAVDHVTATQTPAELTFMPVGLGGSARRARFFAPADPSHVSHSIIPGAGGSDFFVAELITLDDIARLSAIHRFDLVKMDIEGAHHEVIASLQDANAPTVLLVEFDLPGGWAANRASLRRLRELDYRVARVERFNVTFVRIGV